MMEISSGEIGHALRQAAANSVCAVMEKIAELKQREGHDVTPEELLWLIGEIVPVLVALAYERQLPNMGRN